MARRPFYGQGGAIPIAKMNMQAATAPGRAYAQMGKDFGEKIGGAIEKYAQNKKEGEAADMQIGAILQNMTPERQQDIESGEGELGKSLSKFIDGELPNSKKKALLGSLMTVNTADQLKRKEQMDAQRFLQQQELTKLNMQIAKQNLARQESADQLAKGEQEKTTNFLNFLAQPGPDQIDPSGLDRNSVLRNIQAGKGATPPARMIPGPSLAEQSVMSPQAKQFIRRARQQNQPIDKVLPMAKQIDQEIAQSQPKAMTPKEEAELKKINLANRKAELELSNLETPKTDYKAGPTIVEDNIFRALDIIKESPMTTTGMGSYLSSIPGTDAKSLKERLGSIKANIGFDYLQAMREASPTGGALGNVSDKELQGLQSVFGSLEQSLDAKELTYNLNLLNYTYNNVIHGKGNHNVFDPRKGGNSPQQTANTIDPADIQSEIDRKKQMIRDRDLQNKYFDNPTIQNLGNVNQGN